MPITQSHIDLSVQILRQFGAQRIWLFGSALNNPLEAADLDLGCEGLAADRFFRALGELMSQLKLDVDLISFESDSPRVRIIKRRARMIYDAGRAA